MLKKRTPTVEMVFDNLDKKALKHIENAGIELSKAGIIFDSLGNFSPEQKREENHEIWLLDWSLTGTSLTVEKHGFLRKHYLIILKLMGDGHNDKRKRVV